MKILRLVLNKNFMSYILVFGATFAVTGAFASDEVKLKKSCIKDYPIVAGETSLELLTIYSQVCDKKYKDNKDRLLLSAAEKFQQLGKNDKALQVVSLLEAQNLQSNELTDIKFLAGLGVANDALNKMRNTEVRYLTEGKTYPVAKNFIDAVKNAAPATVLVEKPEVQNSVATVRSQKPHKTKSVKSHPTPTRPPVVSSPPKSKPKTTVQPNTSTPSKNPFGDLNK